MEKLYHVICYSTQKPIWQEKKVEFTQYDSETSKIELTLYNDVDKPMTDITYCEFTSVRPDNTAYTFGTENFIVNGNVITLIVPPGGVYAVGKHTGSVAVYGDNMQRLTVLEFTYTVIEDLISDAPIDETNNYPILTGLINEVQNMPANEDTRQANEAVRQTNEANRINAENDRVNTVNSIVSAYDTATKANLSVEVSNARGSFGTLQSRLDNSDSKLSDIAININVFKTAVNTWDDALQAAFNNMRTAADLTKRGGRLLFPSGVFDLSPFTLPMRVILDGCGVGITVLKLKAASTTHFVTLNTYSKFSGIKNMTIDGNKTNCPISLDGIYFVAKDGGTPHNAAELSDKTEENASAYTYNVFENVAVYNTKSHGIEINSSYWGSTFKNIFTYACDGHGIFNKTTDIFFDSIQTEQSGLSGIHELGANNRWSNVKSIWNCRLDNSAYAGIYVKGNRNLFVNVEVQDNYGNGMWIDSCNSIIANNCLFDTNGRIYGQADAGTNGQFIGNAACAGLKVTNSYNVKVAGEATTYINTTNFFIQNKAYSVDNSSYNVELSIKQLGQYYMLTESILTADANISDDMLFSGLSGAIPTFDANGLQVNSNTKFYINSKPFKDCGTLQFIFNASAVNSYGKILTQPGVSPYHDLIVQRSYDGTNDKFFIYFPYKTYSTHVYAHQSYGFSLANNTFPLNVDVNVVISWNKVIDGITNKLYINISVTYGTNNIKYSTSFSDIDYVTIAEKFLKISNEWTGYMKFLKLTSDYIPSERVSSKNFTIDTNKHKENTLLYYNFKNYVTKASLNVYNWNEWTGETTMPAATAFMRGKVIYLQDDTNGDKVFACRRKSDGTYEFVDLTL